MARNRDTYEARLIRTILYSSDVLPQEVSDLLSKVSGRGYRDIKDLMLDEFLPLVDNIPTEYVDFALNALILSGRTGGDLYSDDHFYFENLGLSDDSRYFPAAHVQGPFLYLLRKNEDEGLRLINTLTNTAVEIWKERAQSSHYWESKRTPVRVVVALPSTASEFWGDDRVYLWFRPRSVGPHSVTSGLMALEVWMEHQIDSGRNPEELFQKVLAGSHCVAVLGVCVSVALAYPNQCLNAVLPIISAPTVWRLDIARAADDSLGSFRIDPFGTHKFIYDQLEERNNRPQRSRDVRALAGLYALSEDESVKDNFQNTMAKFTENLPFLFKDEKENPATVDSLRERMQAYQALAKPENYCFIQTGERIEIHFQPPDKMKAQDQVELRQANQYLSWMSTSMWAQKTLEEGSPSPSMTLEQAVEAAKNFATSEDFLVPYSLSGDLDSLRLQAIAGVAAAVLNTVFDWAVSEGLIDWCTGVLLAAARAQRHSDFMDVPETQFPADPKVSAGRGLGKLIEHGRANQDVREQILKLMGDPHFQVVQSVISGLQGAWDSDRCLCWNALSLGLNLACPPRSSRYGKRSSNDGKASAWVEEQIEEHLRHLDNREFPDLPNIDETDGTVFRWKLGLTIICSLPLSTLAADSEAKASMLRLTDDLMRLTIRQNELESERQKGYWHQPPWAWNSGFLRWAARLAHHLNLEECRRHILEPIRDCWATSPHLTADLLFGYIDQQIRFVGPLRPETSQVWREIAEWVLNSQEVIKGHYLERDVEDALALLVFVRFGRFLLDNGWTHIDAFSDVIDNWVSVVGHLPRPYANLLELLSTESASTLDTSIMLKWLGAAMASDKPDDFWSESSNGVRTARLLQRLWASREEEIGSGPSLLQVYSQIVDELVTAGVPLAGLLRRRLERRA